MYKGQRRILRQLMTGKYKEFLVQDKQLQESIPNTIGVYRLPTLVSAGDAAVFCKTAQLVEPISVARVSPRSSKGHHRPVIAPSFLQLDIGSPSKKLL